MDVKAAAEHILAAPPSAKVRPRSDDKGYTVYETHARLCAQAVLSEMGTSDAEDAKRFRSLPRWIMAIIWKRSEADLPPLGHLKDGFELDDLRVWCDEAMKNGIDDKALDAAIKRHNDGPPCSEDRHE